MGTADGWNAAGKRKQKRINPRWSQTGQFLLSNDVCQNTFKVGLLATRIVILLKRVVLAIRSINHARSRHNSMDKKD